MIQNRDKIVKNGEVEIAYIDKQLVYPTKNNIENIVIVTVSCAFCVALVIFNWVCQRKK